jgi:hypothetical protein
MCWIRCRCSQATSARMSRLNPANSRVTRQRAVGLLDQNRDDVLHPMHVDAGNPLMDRFHCCSRSAKLRVRETSSPRRPTGRAVGGDAARVAGPSDRQVERDNDRSNAISGGDRRTLDEDPRRISIIDEPPPEEGRRQIDGLAGDQKPGRSERLLKAKPPRRPLGSAPHFGESCSADQKDVNAAPM